jgi:hypothetical protein
MEPYSRTGISLNVVTVALTSAAKLAAQGEG